MLVELQPNKGIRAIILFAYKTGGVTLAYHGFNTSQSANGSTGATEKMFDFLCISSWDI